MMGATYAKFVKLNELEIEYRLINANKKTKASKGFSKKLFYNSVTCLIEEGIQVLTIIGMMTLGGLGERCFNIFYLYLFLYNITLIKMFGKLNKLCHFLKFLNMSLIFFYSCLVKIIYTGRIIDSSIMNGVIALIILLKIIEFLICIVILLLKKRKSYAQLSQLEDIINMSPESTFLGYPRDFFYSIHKDVLENTRHNHID